MLKHLKWRENLSVYLVLIAIINFLLLFFPLTNNLGFEFSAVNAILLCLLSGFYSTHVISKNSSSNHPTNVSSLFYSYSIMLMVPFVISFINSVLVGLCSFFDGVLFYFVITVPSVIVGGCLASLNSMLVKKYSSITFLLIYLLVLLIALVEFYFNPQVYLFNPVFAYFPGTIYDEGLSVSSTLFFYRILNLTFFGSFFVLFIYKINRKKKSYKLILSFLLITILFIYISPILNFSTTSKSLQNQLSYKTETKNFIIYSDVSSGKEQLIQLALHCEYYHQALKKFYQVEPQEKFIIYLFPSQQKKKEIFGSGNADVAKPWLKHVYTSEETWENTIKHELAHCFSAEFGTGVFKVADWFNPALIEGSAEAADGFSDENIIHYLAAVAYKNEIEIDLKKLFSGYGFLNQISSLAYTYAGSFCKYLIENYGIEKFKALYSNNDFEKIYSTSIDSIISEYQIFLNNLFSDKYNAKAIYYFGRKSIFQKYCPRSVAEELSEAWENYNNKNYLFALKDFSYLLKKTNSYSALVGNALSLEKIDSLTAAIRIIESLIDDFSGEGTYYNLSFRLADLYSKNDQFSAADSIYNFIIQQKPNINLENLSYFRRILIKQNIIVQYLQGSDLDKYSILKELNKGKYNYHTFPALIELSKSLEENYNKFKKQFENNLVVTDYYSSYAVFKLSQYMLKNNDFDFARKLAGLAVRFDDDYSIAELLQNNFDKARWFFEKGNYHLKRINFSILR